MSLITISRMYGSGGSEIAARVAAALDWDLFDNALVEEVAQRLGVPVAEVEAREERVPTLAQRLGAALALGAPETLPGPGAATLPPSEERLVEVTTHLIREIVQRGHAVLVGHGAQAVLAEREDVLHVYCCAPRQALAGRVATRLGLSPKEAEHRVDEINRQREQYVRRYYDRSWSSPASYHLCLNTEWLGIDGAAEIIVRVARRRFGLSPLHAP